MAVLLVAGLVTYVVLAADSTGPPAPAAAPSPAVDALPPSAAPVPPAVPAGDPVMGISAPTLADLDRFTRATGTRPEVFDTFEAWSRDRPLDRELADGVALRGARLSVTWEPWASDGPRDRQPDYTLASIADGRHDAYIDLFAASVRDHGHPVTIRLMHEMNGDWYPWGATANGNRPEDFVAAWRHVHDRFTALGATEVAWLWAPNAVYPGSAPLAPLYPGDEYVDLVGVSNYNWGERSHDGFATRWRSFGSLFDESIAELAALTDRPIWITEIGSSDLGGSKGEWLAQTAAEVVRRQEIAGLVWFDHLDTRHGVDWRIEHDERATAAWRAAFTARR
ncbi:glycosyl hydrolase [Geodermatophilus sp. DSM 44513]|uniref:glycoside hydrolase family 26 protein n=1 Tax=Geodermatophilus sp. DSM 44513 TaxID=1528104 RepID=UPI00126B57BE|nr:glycosyl hydrolase [Geodermatophilus sp. DSM 44513]WNV76375.1 glycosyl hydrolase [Geodermatophilus sp. DSM 44513]